MDYFVEIAGESRFPEGAFWRSIDQFEVCLPTSDSTAATIVVCSDIMATAMRRERCSIGWLVIVNDETVGSDSQWAMRLKRLLSRLGVVVSRVVFVVELHMWGRVLPFIEDAMPAQVVVVSTSSQLPLQVFSGLFEGMTAPQYAWNRTRNDRALGDLTTIVLPSSVELSSIFPAVRAVVTFPESMVAANVVAGLCRIAQVISCLGVVWAGGGSLAAYIAKAMSNVGPQSPGGFLSYLDGDSRFGRLVRLQLEFVTDGLMMYGFDLVPWKRADSWGARSHSVSVFDRHGAEVASKQLGALRRLALDSLINLTPGVSTQAYAAFGFASDSLFSWWELGDGQYQIAVTDETGADIVPFAAVNLVNAGGAHENRCAKLDFVQPGSRLLLELSSV